MVAKIISGNQISKIVYSEVKEEMDNAGIYPGLAVILVGSNPASISYVKRKEIACNEVGIHTETFSFEENISQDKLIKFIYKLNQNEKFSGILVQLPLPSHLDEQNIIDSILPIKDVDGLTSENSGLLFLGQPRFIPATPYGILRLLKENKITTKGKTVVIVGRSKLVGLPLASILLRKGDYVDATVISCHSKTNNLAQHTKKADILVAAIGSPKFITQKMVSHNTCVIDVGVNRVIDTKKDKGFALVGDVDYEKVKNIASYITPVPGGVGPMTVAMLLKNVSKSAKILKKIK